MVFFIFLRVLLLGDDHGGEVLGTFMLRVLLLGELVEEELGLGTLVSRLALALG